MGAFVLSPVTAGQWEEWRVQSWESGLRAGLAGESCGERDLGRGRGVRGACPHLRGAGVPRVSTWA